MRLDDLLPRLDAVRPRGNGRYAARCPAHADKSPSLSISEGEKGILLKCWAGCTTEEICIALGIQIADLFFDAGVPHRQRPTPSPPRLDRRAAAFQFELGALDLRFRAERVLTASTLLDRTRLSDGHMTRLMDVVASAYQDVERAQLFEHVSDGLREKDYQERQDRHAA